MSTEKEVNEGERRKGGERLTEASNETGAGLKTSTTAIIISPRSLNAISLATRMEMLRALTCASTNYQNAREPWVLLCESCLSVPLFSIFSCLARDTLSCMVVKTGVKSSRPFNITCWKRSILRAIRIRSQDTLLKEQGVSHKGKLFGSTIDFIATKSAHSVSIIN